MTQDEIYQMVKQSELGFLLGDNWMLYHELEYFAKLVAEHEREECLKLADSLGWVNVDHIQARGESK